MKVIYKSILFTALSFIAFSCNDEFENDINNIEISRGNANFSNYVAIGNSLTSGYANGALYRSAQESSFPAILAGQMMSAGGGEFTQPLMPDDIGGFSDLGVSGKLELKIIDGERALVPLASQTSFQSSFVSGPFNNMGVPGAKSYHLVAPGYGNAANLSTGKANPYFVRFATSSSTTVLQDVLAKKPTFFTLWIGNNDVLSYATSGGVGKNQAGNFDPSTYGGNDISAPEVVANVVKTISELMVSNEVDGAIANIPDVTSIPYFTTVPAKPLDPNSNQNYAAQINTLNGFFNNLNQVFKALGAEDRQIMFDGDKPSGIIFIDDSLEDLSQQIATTLMMSGVSAQEAKLIAGIYGQARQSREGDYLPLTMSTRIGKLDETRMNNLKAMGVSDQEAGLLSLIGLTYPADEFVLSEDEISQVTAATQAMNSAIQQIALSNDLAFVDMNSEMKNLQKGMVYDAVNYNASFITGGAFSLDGVHLNSRGYAIVSNIFIDAINQKYKSTLRKVNPNNYTGTMLP